MRYLRFEQLINGRAARTTKREWSTESQASCFTTKDMIIPSSKFNETGTILPHYPIRLNKGRAWARFPTFARYSGRKIAKYVVHALLLWKDSSFSCLWSHFIAWENRRHFATPTTFFPPNDVWDLGAFVWSCSVGNLLQPIRSTIQIWVVTRH